MQGDKQVIQFLNQILTNELTAINQYMMHYKLCEHWGFMKLAERNRKESIEEMRHAESLMERILFLEGLPNLQDLHKINVGRRWKSSSGWTWTWKCAQRRCCAKPSAIAVKCAMMCRKTCCRRCWTRKKSISTGLKPNWNSSRPWGSRITCNRRCRRPSFASLPPSPAA